jgi:hypothetical protein
MTYHVVQVLDVIQALHTDPFKSELHDCEERVSEGQVGGVCGEVGTRELIHPAMTTRACEEVVEAVRQSTETVSVRCPVRGCALNAQFHLNEGDAGKRMALYGSAPCCCVGSTHLQRDSAQRAIIPNHVSLLLACHF